MGWIESAANVRIEASVGKWLELLKQIAPRDARGSPPGSRHRRRIGQFAAIQSVAPSLGVEFRPIDMRDAGEIERAIAAFARGRTAA